MKKDVSVFLQHIIESIVKIEEFTKGDTKADFISSAKTQDAVIRRLEIIGEAVKNMPSDFIKKHPDVPWSEIARTRDKLIHGYFGVDLDITWTVVKSNLPSLKKKISEIIEQLKR